MSYYVEEVNDEARDLKYYRIGKGLFIHIGHITNEMTARKFVNDMCEAKKLGKRHGLTARILIDNIGSNGVRYRLIQRCTDLGLTFAICRKLQFLPFWFTEISYWDHTDDDSAAAYVSTAIFNKFLKHGHKSKTTIIEEC